MRVACCTGLTGTVMRVNTTLQSLWKPKAGSDCGWPQHPLPHPPTLGRAPRLPDVLYEAYFYLLLLLCSTSSPNHPLVLALRDRPVATETVSSRSHCAQSCPPFVELNNPTTCTQHFSRSRLIPSDRWACLRTYFITVHRPLSSRPLPARRSQAALPIGALAVSLTRLSTPPAPWASSASCAPASRHGRRA